MKRWILGAAVAVLGGCATGGMPAPTAAGASTAPADFYDAWVTSESADQIARVRFTPGAGAEVVQRREVGSMPVEIDGPHGVAVAPDGEFIYVTIGHGLPYGQLWKIDPRTDERVGRAVLGLFPATVSVTPDGAFAFISNFNLHGDPVPSSISKVHLGTMAEVARIETCVMPHGSRVSPDGTRHYSVCMMDQRLVEIDVATGAIERTFSVAPGMEGPVDGAPMRHDAQGGDVCSPTWAEPSADGSHVYVTCNRGAEVLEIDVEEWSVSRRFATGEAPYNLATTPDGRYLLVSLRNRTDPALEVYDLATGRQAGRIATSTSLVHGIAVTTDARYAFVTSEGVGSEAGRVDVVDLSTLERVATADVAQQATGVAVVP